MNKYLVTSIFKSGKELSQEVEAVDEREALITFSAREHMAYSIYNFDEDTGEPTRKDTLLSVKVEDFV